MWREGHFSASSPLIAFTTRNIDGAGRAGKKDLVQKGAGRVGQREEDVERRGQSSPPGPVVLFSSWFLHPDLVPNHPPHYQESTCSSSLKECWSLS